MSDLDSDLSSGPETQTHLFAMGQKEIRRVPLGWEHPAYTADELAPNQYYLLGRQKALQSRDGYTDAEIEELSKKGVFEFMPDFPDVPDEQMGICIYETVSDGTPVSRVFPDTPAGRLKLIQFAANELDASIAGKAGAEAWVAILGAGTVIDIRTGRVTTHPS